MRLSLFIVSVLIAFSFTACSSVPQEKITSPSVTIRLATKNEIEMQGWLEGNPYRTPGDIVLGGGSEDFVVLVADFALPQAEIASLVYTKAEDDSVHFYDRDAFLNWWSTKGSKDIKEIRSRERTIQLNCLPSGDIKVPAGRHKYFIVFIGKDPLPKTIEIKGQMLLGNDGVDFDVKWP